MTGELIRPLESHTYKANLTGMARGGGGGGVGGR